MRILKVIILIAFIQSLASCTMQKADRSTINIIPKPAKMEILPGFFEFTTNTGIVADLSNVELKDLAALFAETIKKSTGFDIKIIAPLQGSGKNQVILLLDQTLYSQLGNEGYKLEVNRKSITITAAATAGIFYGTQTIYQLLPTEIYSARLVKENILWTVPCLNITDKPAFSWRGMHLDVSRHFFPKEFIKNYIDLIAMHKMNIFQWHLTDDNGWRLEIKKYPKLTEISAWRVDREDDPWGEREPQQPGEEATYGGYYSQDDVREIVEYAKQRYVTIIPEIEMPGHSCEVFAAYPEYSCTGKKLTVQPGSYWPNLDIFCAGKEGTFQFLDDVLTEVAGLFPSLYIHIGGDEADKTRWSACPNCKKRIKEGGLKNEDELQSYFIKRIEQILLAKNKKLIGWDEILQGGLAPEATVMSWRGFDGGFEAAQQGHDVIMCPVSHCYFDYYQADPKFQPPAIGGLTTLKKVYSFRPVPPGLTTEETKHILGAQGNIWTEFIPTSSQAEYMAVPRMTALAEVLWSPQDSLNWYDFRNRLHGQFNRFKVMGINYCEGSFKVNMIPEIDPESGKYDLAFETEDPNCEIRYTTDGSMPGITSLRYNNPLQVTSDITLEAVSFKNGKMMEAPNVMEIAIHQAIGRKVIYVNEPSFKYRGTSDIPLVDGIHGSLYYNDGYWQGFQGEDFSVTIDLGKYTSINSVSATFLQDQDRYIFLPKNVRISVSPNGEDFIIVGEFSTGIPQREKQIAVKDYTARPDIPVNARYIRVIAENIGVCPGWHPGAGDKAWIFADEIVVK